MIWTSNFCDLQIVSSRLWNPEVSFLLEVCRQESGYQILVALHWEPAGACGSLWELVKKRCKIWTVQISAFVSIGRDIGRDIERDMLEETLKGQFGKRHWKGHWERHSERNIGKDIRRESGEPARLIVILFERYVSLWKSFSRQR